MLQPRHLNRLRALLQSVYSSQSQYGPRSLYDKSSSLKPRPGKQGSFCHSADTDFQSLSLFYCPYAFQMIIDHSDPPSSSPCRSEEHTSELQSRFDIVCRLLLEKKNV